MGRIFWRSLRTGLSLSLTLGWKCMWCLTCLMCLFPVLLWSLSFVVVFSCCSDWEYVEQQSFSFSKNRAYCRTITQEEMRHESTQVKSPPYSRRRMRPPTPLQNWNSSLEEEQGRFEVEDHHCKNETVPGRKKKPESGS